MRTKDRRLKIIERQLEQERIARRRVAGNFAKSTYRLDVEKEAIRLWIHDGRDHEWLPSYYRSVNWRHVFFNY